MSITLRASCLSLSAQLTSYTWLILFFTLSSSDSSPHAHYVYVHLTYRPTLILAIILRASDPSSYAYQTCHHTRIVVARRVLTNACAGVCMRRNLRHLVPPDPILVTT
eukprot:2293598-Rhodomonas_salina.3